MLLLFGRLVTKWGGWCQKEAAVTLNLVGISFEHPGGTAFHPAHAAFADFLIQSRTVFVSPVILVQRFCIYRKA
jgi:hypothetical protein